MNKLIYVFLTLAYIFGYVAGIEIEARHYGVAMVSIVTVAIELILLHNALRELQNYKKIDK